MVNETGKYHFWWVRGSRGVRKICISKIIIFVIHGYASVGGYKVVYLIVFGTNWFKITVLYLRYVP